MSITEDGLSILTPTTPPKEKKNNKNKGTWGFKVLQYWAFFLSNISVTLILMCNIAVSSSPAECDFLFLWLTVLGIKKKIFENIVVVFICPLLPNAGQYFKDFRLTGKWLNNFWQLFYDEIGKASQWQGFSIVVLIITKSVLTFSHNGWGWLQVHTCLR